MACHVYVLMVGDTPEAVYTNEEGGRAAHAQREGADLFMVPFRDGPPSFKLPPFGNEAKRFFLEGKEPRHGQEHG